MTGQRRAPVHVRTEGAGPRTLWVHGTMSDPPRTWRRQSPLTERWLLLQPARRGTPPSPPADGNDFLEDARDLVDLLDEPLHVVAHSYGCIGTLLAVGRRPEHVTSLTLIEPPAFQLLEPDPEAVAAIDAFGRLRDIGSPEEFLAAFLETVLGTPTTQVPLDPTMRLLVELSMRERPPWQADLPLEAIRDAGTPVLVVTGAHSDLFERSADAVVQAIGPSAARARLPGAGHTVQRLGEPFNALVEEFWARH